MSVSEGDIMILSKFLVFGFLGLFIQLSYNALKSLVINKNWSLVGEVSLWMIPLYGLIVFVYPYTYFKVSSYGIVMRGIAYMLVFFIVQFVIGWILNRFRACPWQYNGKLAVAGGIIDFSYAPIWFAAGLLIEKINPFVSKIASVL